VPLAGREPTLRQAASRRPDSQRAEQGGDTVYLLNDGVRDVVYCGTVVGGEPGDKVVLINGRDPLDQISNCPSF
jgi:hypothetical protein